MISKVITPHQAVKRMRELTSAGVPFSFEYLSYNDTNYTSKGFKVIDNAILRMGYRNDQSDKSSQLIGYTSNKGDNRWFYLPLLTKFNNYIIKG
jgi:hypothetical protein